MNIYEMYVANGNKCGFLVWRTTWRQTLFFQVLRVAGAESGFLLGRAPYYGNPSVTGRLIEIGVDGKVSLVDPDYRCSCPGTYKTWCLYMLSSEFSITPPFIEAA